MYAPPISTGESRITGLGIWGMIEQLLNCSLCKGGMALGAGRVSQIFCEAGPVADWAITAAGTGCAVSRRRIRGYGVVSHLRIEFGGLVVPAKGDYWEGSGMVGMVCGSDATVLCESWA
jgi:hypothetical protein